MTAKDSGTPIGPEATLSHAVSVNIYPNTANLSFETLPNPNLQIIWDTELYQAPITFEGVVNMSRSFGVVDDQAFDGRHWTWLNWNDGGPRDREISFPPIDTTYTATFGCDVIVEASGLNVARGPVQGEYTLTWDPVVDSCLTQTLDAYEIYASSSPVPATLPGSFPDDPLFTLVGSTSGTSFSHASAATGSFFLVVAVGTDNKPGVLGHYGE